MCPQVSHRWCDVSHRIGAPQLSHGARPPRAGWQAGAVATFDPERAGASSMRPTVVTDCARVTQARPAQPRAQPTTGLPASG
jgi:hypothetical protein